MTVRESRIVDRYNTIIWDWNGTLLNDVWLCVKIVNEILHEQNGQQLDESKYKEVFGFPIVDYYERIGIDFSKESFESLTVKFISNYDENVKQSGLHESVVDVLKKMEEKKMDQFILTAGHKESVTQLLEHYSIKDFFLAIEGLDNHRAESKVSRGIKLLDQHQINKKAAVLIGDTIHDFEVANEIGVDCVLIPNGHHSYKKLRNGTPANIEILRSMGDLLK